MSLALHGKETRYAAKQHRAAFHDGDVSGPKVHSAELGNPALGINTLGMALCITLKRDKCF